MSPGGSGLGNVRPFLLGSVLRLFFRVRPSAARNRLIAAGLTAFRGVPHRLEIVAEGDGTFSGYCVYEASDPEALRLFTLEGTTAFYGNFFSWVNYAALGLQALVASRLLKYGGFAAILLLLPGVALVSYTAMAIVPILGVVKFMKVAENSTDYSINNTARHVLWLLPLFAIGGVVHGARTLLPTLASSPPGAPWPTPAGRSRG